MKQLFSHKYSDYSNLRNSITKLSEAFQHCCILDSNNWLYDRYQEYDIIAGFGSARELNPEPDEDSFQAIKNFHNQEKDWLLGYLSYDLKNEIENLNSNNHDGIDAPKMKFFVPKLLILAKQGNIEVLIHEDHQYKEDLLTIAEQFYSVSPPRKALPLPIINIKHRLKKGQYLDAVNAIRSHIKHGDVYELNYCQEFYAEEVEINSTEIYSRLNKKSPTPFSAFVKTDNIHLISSSPERYIKKSGNKVISQPIKGTARRVTNEDEDAKVINELKNNIKERAENIMIVDLVRNDLSRIASTGSVIVKELCEIYSFRQVHQMISTIEATIDNAYNFTDIIKSTFPMGSMTGAPKIKAMELIEKYEHTKRGIFSGAIGYITPEADFDFNVVIRSIIYNSNRKYLSFITGGAITYESDSLKEYEESLLKAEALFDILS